MKRFILFLILIIVLFFLYARYIGVNGLEVKEYTISNEDLANNYGELTIAHFSDLLYGSTVNIEMVKDMVNKINDYKPDIVVFTGDLISDGYTLSDDEKNSLKESLKEIYHNQNMFAIKGDNDISSEELFNEIMSDAGFTILNNSNELIFNKKNTAVLIAGINDFNEISTSLSNDTEYIYSIILINKSDYVDKLYNSNINLVIAGHSLGGILKIPFIGGILKQENAEKYLDGYYKINDNTELYVSSGIGTNKYHIRAFNPPSINIYRLGYK